MSFTPLNVELLESAVFALPDDQLTPVRREAFNDFVQHGLPTTRDEDWRYTNLASIADIGNRWLQEPPGSSDVAANDGKKPITARDNIDAYWIEFRDGQLTPDANDMLLSLAGSGVTMQRLSSADEQPSLYTGDPLSSLNAALMSDALHIRLDDGAKPDKPIGFLFADHVDGVATAVQPRILIDVASGASVDFVEAHQSTGSGDYFSNLVSEIGIGPDAHVRFLKIQECDEAHSQIGRARVTLDSDSTFDHFSLDIGGKLVRNDIIMILAGAGALASTSGLYLANGRQHIDNHLHAEHRVGPATSRQIYRGIANGRARCVFNGKAVVREGADGTDAEQSNHNLLLSDRAEIDTKPELEIYADDVKCSHGATIGQLDRSALFYLRSRGLDSEQAAQVLTRAFASRVVSAVPISAAREYIESRVDAKLDTLVEEKCDE